MTKNTPPTRIDALAEQTRKANEAAAELKYLLGEVRAAINDLERLRQVLGEDIVQTVRRQMQDYVEEQMIPQVVRLLTQLADDIEDSEQRITVQLVTAVERQLKALGLEDVMTKLPTVDELVGLHSGGFGFMVGGENITPRSVREAAAANGQPARRRRAKT